MLIKNTLQKCKKSKISDDLFKIEYNSEYSAQNIVYLVRFILFVTSSRNEENKKILEFCPSIIEIKERVTDVSEKTIFKSNNLLETQQTKLIKSELKAKNTIILDQFADEIIIAHIQKHTHSKRCFSF
ncbi:MAG: hypothetical protein CL760_10400 [Chloroflexi bacterium]|nr:hypothetical protein [Chloroflexota bacterium]|tara:strand:+ start:15759 stop:16142 length:384 start_codon:yes stop_codon:yes gene_type:complete